jgi:uncharacterized protein
MGARHGLASIGTGFDPAFERYRQRRRRLARGSRLGAIPLLWMLLIAAVCAAELVFPPLTGRVVDLADVIPAETRARIEAKLAAHETKTGDQVVVATLGSLQEAAVEEFANRLFRHWKLGEKDRNNGVLLLVAPSERKLRIEVGYGLEGALTDALSKVIITTAIAPRFRTDDFGGGIEAGIDAILGILDGDANEWQRRAKVRDDDGPAFGDLLVLAVFAIIFLILVSRIVRSEGRRSGGSRWHRTRQGQWVVLPGPGWPGGGFSGSGSSDGGFFSGGGFTGGGGSSGGGGASGDW